MSQTGAGSEFAAMLNLSLGRVAVSRRALQTSVKARKLRYLARTQNPDHHKMVHHRLWVAWCLLLSGLAPTHDAQSTHRQREGVANKSEAWDASSAWCLPGSSFCLPWS